MYKTMKKVLKEYESFLENNHSFFLNNLSVFYHYSRIISSSKYNYKHYINRDELQRKLTYFSKDEILKIVSSYYQDIYKLEFDSKIINFYENEDINNCCYFDKGECKINVRLYNNLQDVTIIVHEYRHYLNMKSNNYNYILDNFTEGLSRFEELNIIKYLEKNYKEYKPEIQLIKGQIFNITFPMSNDYVCFFNCYHKFKSKNKFDYNKALKLKRIYIKSGFSFHYHYLYIAGLLLGVYLFISLENNTIRLEDINKFNDELSTNCNYKVFNIIKLVPDNYNVLKECYSNYFDNHL